MSFLKEKILFYTMCLGEDKYFEIMNLCLDSFFKYNILGTNRLVLLTDRDIPKRKNIEIVDIKNTKYIFSKPAFTKTFIDIIFNIKNFTRIFYFDIDILFFKSLLDLIDITNKDLISVGCNRRFYGTKNHFINAGLYTLDLRKFPSFFHNWRKELNSCENSRFLEQDALVQSLNKNYKKKFEIIDPKYGFHRISSETFFSHYYSHNLEKMKKDYKIFFDT